MPLTVKALLWQAGVWLLSILALFGPAGTLAWCPGWIFFASFFGFVFWLSIWLTRHDPDLLNARLAILKADQPGWDRVWVLSFYVLSLVWFALMPVDAVRCRWSHMPGWIIGFGLVLLMSALVGIFLTIRANRFLSPVVHLQHARGQVVISSGPYGLVRHPLYSSASLFYLSVPLVLGSWFGLITAPVFIVLMAGRAIGEEKLLSQGLPGYRTYAKQVPWRFVPKLW
jgi:protein-S-isoprenylcysteine O-methyltransferase Ste14